MSMKRHITVNCKKQPIRKDDPGFSISSVKPEYPAEKMKRRIKRKPNYKYQSKENQTICNEKDQKLTLFDGMAEVEIKD